MRILPIKGYEDRYTISESGVVTAIKRTIVTHGVRVETTKPRELTPSLDRKGYLIVNLYDGNGVCKSMKVHRLVAEAFLPNAENKRCVCHKDNNPQNNHLSNLYWGTDQENQTQAWEDGLHKSMMPIESIATDGTIKQYKSQNEASRQTGIPQQNISKCVNGYRKTAGGYQWRKSV